MCQATTRQLNNKTTNKAKQRQNETKQNKTKQKQSRNETEQNCFADCCKRRCICAIIARRFSIHLRLALQIINRELELFCWFVVALLLVCAEFFVRVSMSLLSFDVSCNFADKATHRSKQQTNSTHKQTNTKATEAKSGQELPKSRLAGAALRQCRFVRVLPSLCAFELRAVCLCRRFMIESQRQTTRQSSVRRKTPVQLGVRHRRAARHQNKVQSETAVVTRASQPNALRRCESCEPTKVKSSTNRRIDLPLKKLAIRSSWFLERCLCRAARIRSASKCAERFYESLARKSISSNSAQTRIPNLYWLRRTVLVCLQLLPRLG